MDIRNFLIRSLLDYPRAKSRPIVMTHWTDGGTGITNFGADKFDIYKEAIETYGDKYLVIVPKPIGFSWSNCMSLHDTRDGRVDLGDFWDVFTELKKNSELRKRGKAVI